jgi:hypothetical protein
MIQIKEVADWVRMKSVARLKLWAQKLFDLVQQAISFASEFIYERDKNFSTLS